MTKKEYVRTYEAESYEQAITMVAEATAHTGCPCLTMRGELGGRNCILCYLPNSLEEALSWTIANPPKERQPDAIIFYPEEVRDESLN